MKRITIRSEESEGRTQVLRFDDGNGNIPLGVLLYKIVSKLEVTGFDKTQYLEKQFQLWIEHGTDGNCVECLLKYTDEIDDGDRVVLKKIFEPNYNPLKACEYSAVIPVTKGKSLFINLSEASSGQGPISFAGYRSLPNGDSSLAEHYNLIRNRGDRVLAVDGQSFEGLPLTKALKWIKKRCETQKIVHFRFLDICSARLLASGHDSSSEDDNILCKNKDAKTDTMNETARNQEGGDEGDVESNEFIVESAEKRRLSREFHGEQEHPDEEVPSRAKFVTPHGTQHLD